MNPTKRSTRRMRIVTLVMAVAIFVPGGYGFGTMFLDLVALDRGDAEGALALGPTLTYLFTSTGFLFLFAWAVTHGMLRDVEQPKVTMLENERRLDADAPWPR